MQKLCRCRRRDVPSGAETVFLQAMEGLPGALLVSPSTRGERVVGQWVVWASAHKAASLLGAFCPWFPFFSLVFQQHCLLGLPWSPDCLLPQGHGKCSVHCSLRCCSSLRDTAGRTLCAPLTGFNGQPEISQSSPAPGSCSSGQAGSRRRPSHSRVLQSQGLSGRGQALASQRATFI